MRIRPRRVLRCWPLLYLGAIPLFIYLAWPGRSTFTVSPETTRITEPLDAKGYVDFPAALNRQLGQGVTPETNANVLIWRALGPHPEGVTMPAEFFALQGVDPPPEQGDYFIDWDKYFAANLKDPPEDVWGLPGDERAWRDPLDGQTWKEKWAGLSTHAGKWPWKAEDHPEIADWLRRNEKPLAVAAEAGKRPAYFNPMVDKSAVPQSGRLMNSLLPGVQKCRAMANALAARAMLRTAEGDLDGAWQDLMACQRLGRVVAKGATLIEHLVGNALVAIATDRMLTLLSEGDVSAARARAWLADLQGLPPMPAVADKIDVGERFMMLDGMMSMACRGPQFLERVAADRPGSSTPVAEFRDRLFTHNIDYDPAFRNANVMYDRIVAAGRLPTRPDRVREFKAIEAEMRQRKWRAVAGWPVRTMVLSRASRGEMIGDILLGLVLPAFSKIVDAADRLEQTQANLHIALALAAYRADQKAYPARLEELVPKYLPAVPADLFSGKPLVYAVEDDGYLLYSVGVNGVDEGGRWRDDNPPGDDLRIRMPVPEPPIKK